MKGVSKGAEGQAVADVAGCGFHCCVPTTTLTTRAATQKHTCSIIHGYTGFPDPLA